GPDVIVRGLAIDGFAFGTEHGPEVLTVLSLPFPRGHDEAGGTIDTYRIDAASGERLVARVHAEGDTTRLLLRDARGRVLLQSDGRSADDPDDLIDVHIPAGPAYLEVETLGRAGTYTLTATLTPATTPFQPIPLVGSGGQTLTGDFNGDGQLDL